MFINILLFMWSKLIEFFGYEVEYIWIIWLVENVCV